MERGPQGPLFRVRLAAAYEVGGDFTCRLLITRTTPSVLRASASASVLTLELGTSPASVTTPLVTLTSMFVMFENRSAASLVLIAVWMLASSTWRPGDCVVEQPASTMIIAATDAARKPGKRFMTGSSSLRFRA